VAYTKTNREGVGGWYEGLFIDALVGTAAQPGWPAHFMDDVRIGGPAGGGAGSGMRMACAGGGQQGGQPLTARRVGFCQL
jgi:hypothetical protein